MVVVWLLSCVWLLRSHGLQPVKLHCPWDSPSKNSGVGCHFLLQRIFLTQELNPCFLCCRRILYLLNMYPIRVDKAGPFALSSRPCTLERERLEIFIRSRMCIPNIYSVFENRFSPTPTPSIIFHQLHTLTDVRMRLMIVSVTKCSACAVCHHFRFPQKSLYFALFY